MISEVVRLKGRSVGKLLTRRAVGGWLLRLTVDRCQHTVPARDGGAHVVDGFVWNIVATHAYREPMVFVYGNEREARAGFADAEEVELFEAAALGEVLS